MSSNRKNSTPVFDRLTSWAKDVVSNVQEGKNNYLEFALISTSEELNRLEPPLVDFKEDVVGRSAAIYVCPATMKGGGEVVFCTPGYEKSELLNMTVDLLTKGGVKPHVLMIDPTLLLTTVYEGREENQQGGKRGSGGVKDRSELSLAFRNIIAWAVEKNASDIHININTDEPRSQIKATIDGHYVAPKHWHLPSGHLIDMVKVVWLDIKGGSNPVFDPRREQQGLLYESIKGMPYMLRWGSFVSDAGPSITLRLQNLHSSHELQSFDDMGYLPSQAEAFLRAQVSEGGAIVLGGVPGSGKTTTIANLLSTLPENRKIMSIEDPVERRILGALQATISRDAHAGTNGSLDPFQSKLMMLKRSAPTDAFLGEIRDTVTGRAFQDIAESGTNLYSTLHVVSALAIPERLASRQVGVPLELLSMPELLKLVGYQALLPVLCKCSLPFSSLFEGGSNSIGVNIDGEGWKRYLHIIEKTYDVDTSTVRVRNPEGCPSCKRKGLPEIYGYGGRTVVAELFELGQYREALIAVRERNVIKLMDFYNSLRVHGYEHPDMTGKTAMDAAVYKMLLGQIDPRDIEPRFSSFESVALARGKSKQIGRGN